MQSDYKETQTTIDPQHDKKDKITLKRLNDYKATKQQQKEAKLL